MTQDNHESNADSGVMLSLHGKVALITGGSRGIGAATVRLFRRAGARVIFNYVAAQESADALVEQCGGADFCVALQQELSTPEQGRALIAAAVKAFGRLDCLIVNHGIWPSQDAPIASMTDAQWHRTMGVNLDSVFGLVRSAVAQMENQPLPGGPEAASMGSPARPVSALARTRGHIVLISSTAGQRGEAFHADYAASKGAIISLTKSLSSELATKGIRVNCVAPGWVATDMSAAALGHHDSAREVFSKIPLGRVGHVDEIAGPVLFLCTPYAGFISGEIFNVNGGAVLVG